MLSFQHKAAGKSVIYLFFFLTFLFILSCDDSTQPPTEEDSDISLVFPPGGTVMFTQADYRIRWSGTGGSGFVRISLLQAGQEIGAIADSTTNDGYYNWGVELFGADGGQNFTIRIAGLDGQNDDQGESEPFTIIDAEACALSFDDPWDTRHLVGETFTFGWTGTGGSGKVDLYLYNFSQPVALIARNLPCPGTLDWVVDLHGENGGDYFNLVLKDPAIPTCSAFSIRTRILDETPCLIQLTTPGIGQVLTEGVTITLDYSAQHTTGTLTLTLYAGTELVGTLMEGISPLENSLDWTVTDLGNDDPSAMYFLHLTDSGDHFCTDADGGFNIQ